MSQRKQDSQSISETPISNSNDMVPPENLASTKIICTATRMDRLVRRDQIRQHDEVEEEMISKEEQDQIERAIALSMMDHKTSTTSVTLTSHGLQNNTLASSSQNTLPSVALKQLRLKPYSQRLSGNHSDCEIILCGSEKPYSQRSSGNHGDCDIASDECSVTERNTGDKSIEEEHHILEYEAKELSNAIDDDDSGSCSSPLLFQTPSPDSVKNAQQENTVSKKCSQSHDQSPIQSSVQSHDQSPDQSPSQSPDQSLAQSRGYLSKMGGYLTAFKDRLSLKKRKRQTFEMERPGKSLKVDDDLQEQQEGCTDISKSVSTTDPPRESVPLGDPREQVVVYLTPFFAPQTKDKAVYTGIILKMLNDQLASFREAQKRLVHRAKMGDPVIVGPFQNACLKHRKRGMKLFTFIDSDDESVEGFLPRKQNSAPRVMKEEPDSGTELIVGKAGAPTVPLLKRTRSELDSSSSSSSDFEITYKKPKLYKDLKKTNEDACNVKVDDDVDVVNDEDDVLYDGETLPFGEDEEVHEDLDEDTQLSRSPDAVRASDTSPVNIPLDRQGTVVDNDTSEIVCCKESLDERTLPLNGDAGSNKEQNGFMKKRRQEYAPAEREQRTENNDVDDVKEIESDHISFKEQRHETSQDIYSNVSIQSKPDFKSDNRGQQIQDIISEVESEESVSVVGIHCSQENEGFFEEKNNQRNKFQEDESKLQVDCRQHQQIKFTEEKAQEEVEGQQVKEEEEEPEEEEQQVEAEPEVEPSTLWDYLATKSEGIPCPLCNICFHQDRIERHASECQGPPEEAADEQIETVRGNAASNSGRSSPSQSPLNHDSESDWLYKNIRKTPIATYVKTRKIEKKKDLICIDASSDEEVQPTRSNFKQSSTNSSDPTSSGSDHIDNVVLEMIDSKEMQISIPKLPTTDRRKSKIKPPRPTADDMERCGFCQELVPKSEYAEHVNAEFAKHNEEEHLHIESQGSTGWRVSMSEDASLHQKPTRQRSEVENKWENESEEF